MFSGDPFGGKGSLLVDDPWKRVWICETSPGVYQTCTETLVDPILEANKEQLNASSGKRWGDGQVVARIPLDMYYRKIVPAKQNGDDAYIKRFLNDSDNAHLRTFGGKI